MIWHQADIYLGTENIKNKKNLKNESHLFISHHKRNISHVKLPGSCIRPNKSDQPHQRQNVSLIETLIMYQV